MKGLANFSRIELESALYSAQLGPVAGVDEAGRGACAGPLVVAACILPPQIQDHSYLCSKVRDSKKITPREREKLAIEIKKVALSYSLVTIYSDELDVLGLQRQNLAGMRAAVYSLDQQPGYVLLDGYRISGLPCPSLAIIHGDDNALCIGAASILAKTSRDAIMRDYDKHYPQYGFSQHKGYCTVSHQQILQQLGPSPIHRFSYTNVQAAIK